MWIDRNNFAAWGVNEPGFEPLSTGLAREWSVLQNEGWTDSQRRVLNAVSANEGCLDGVNTYDIAFLSVGILQWALFTRQEQCGELAALLSFIESVEPAAYEEFFGRVGIGHADVTRFPDGVPRGFITIAGAVMNALANLEQMRGYEWATRFRVALLDRDLQRAQLRFAYDRFRLLRDYPVTLGGVAYRIGAMFSSEHAVAHLFDQHTNNPPRLGDNIRTAIQAVTTAAPPAGGFDDATQRAIIARYIDGNRNMTDPFGRRDQINAHGLNESFGSFTWPTGPSFL
jgi:hypothetical protein